MTKRGLWTWALYLILGLSILSCSAREDALRGDDGDVGGSIPPSANYEAAFEQYNLAQEASRNEKPGEAARHYLDAARNGFDPNNPMARRSACF